MKTVTVTNPTRTRKWGFGYSTEVVDGEHGYSIAAPNRPDYTGTMRQVQSAIDGDMTYKTLKRGGTLMSSTWFYDGQPVLNFSDVIQELEYAEAVGRPVPPVELIIEEA